MRQSASARWVGLIAVVIVSLFVIGYYFYELGLPGGLSKSRLAAALEAEQVVSVERGYNIYQANCAQCHGVNGEGGKGPILNDQVKLFAHLNPDYIHSMLQVGGRFACGNPNSIMPVWANTGTPPGPLNYKQIENVIAFIRAENGHTYRVMDPGPVRAGREPGDGRGGDVQGLGRPELDAGPGLHAVPRLLVGPVQAIRGPGGLRRDRVRLSRSLRGAVGLGRTVRGSVWFPGAVRLGRVRPAARPLPAARCRRRRRPRSPRARRTSSSRSAR